MRALVKQVDRFALFPDGRRAAIAGPRPRVVSLQSGAEQLTFEGKKFRAVAVSPAQTHVAFARMGKDVYIYRPDRAAVELSLSHDDGETLGLAFLSRTQLLHVTWDGLRVLDIGRKRVGDRLPLVDVRRTSDPRCSSWARARNGTLAVAWNWWRTTRREVFGVSVLAWPSCKVKTVVNLDGDARALAFDRDAKRLFVVCHDKTLAAIDVASGRVVWKSSEPPGVASYWSQLALSPRGERLAAWSGDDIVIRDVRSRDVVERIGVRGDIAQLGYQDDTRLCVAARRQLFVVDTGAVKSVRRR